MPFQQAVGSRKDDWTHLWTDLFPSIQEVARKDFAANDGIRESAENLAFELDGEPCAGRELDEHEFRASSSGARREEGFELVERACSALRE